MKFHPRPLRNERGQMAVFIAMIFQVFFVLFAMIVNVGLIVYQKVNLQNSVDLAAYYAAQRQAEILNAIAHENYQIRQAYKLLAWRYRVLGMTGLEGHPAGPYMSLPAQDIPWVPSYNVNGQPGGPVIPVVCISHAEWDSTPGQETLCRNIDAINFYPVFEVVFDILGLATRAKGIFEQGLVGIKKRCDKAGAQNWYYTAMMWWAYRHEISYHRKTIKWLASSLQRPNDFADLQGDSVKEGVEKTLRNNLTTPNETGLDTVELVNSLGNVPWYKWLRDIPIRMDMQYVNTRQNTKGAGSCERFGDSVRKFDISRAPIDQNAAYSFLAQWTAAEPVSVGGEPAPERSSLGFEKNPWYMAYTGVKAKVKVNSIFHPFSAATEMEARAFAQPFGGRIGPWYGAVWPFGKDRSSSQSPIDPLVPFRDEKDEPPPENPYLPDQQERFYPNYSRFPGDRLGLKSQLALTTIIPKELRVATFSLSHYVGALSEMPGNDGLIWNEVAPLPPPALREYEVAAVAPDIFDATYYSIDANFYDNYYTPMRKRQQRLSADFTLRRDFGSHQGAGPQFEKFGVREQIATSKKLFQPPGSYFYFIRDPFHLLTSWVAEKLYEYSEFPTRFFGKCEQEAFQSAPVPGQCAVGGRVGYSVRLISKSYLLSPDHALGGPSGGKGALLNPPRDF